jgi:hypothetical protein
MPSPGAAEFHHKKEKSMKGKIALEKHIESPDFQATGNHDEYPIIQKVEIHLIHFSKGLEPKEEGEDHHVVNAVLHR